MQNLRGKPSGYFVTIDPATGRRIEGETRQCKHCQRTWIYEPSAPNLIKVPALRGWCAKCNGFLCGEPSCMATCTPWQKKIELAEKGHDEPPQIYLPNQ